jgi:CHRD domain/PEP-CTERM motif
MSMFRLAPLALALSFAAGAASAATQVYSFNLSGLQEVPANASPAAGSMQITIDDTTNVISYQFTSFNLAGSFLQAHIHRALAGVNGPVVYDLVTAADYSGPVTFGPNISIPNSWALLGQNETNMAAGLGAMINTTPWNYYVNIHTSAFPGGEIRGQLAPIPEAGTWAMMLAGIAVVGWQLRRRVA